jgi:RNA polymerase sigma factor (sigma-70 family)
MEQPAELLQRFAHGDLDAFETLFRQFQGDVYRWTVRIVRDHGIAEDLTIETFWRIHRARARFDPKRSFGAWARRIATNTALDYLKRSRRETELPQDLQGPTLPNPGVTEDVRQRVNRAFGQLPAKLRVAATLALIEEEPYQEIAEALGISVGAVKLRVFRAVRLLRKQLKQLGVEP